MLVEISKWIIQPVWKVPILGMRGPYYSDCLKSPYFGHLSFRNVKYGICNIFSEGGDKKK